jgi:hypothetical protein
MDDRGAILGRCFEGTFLLATTCRPALGPTKPPIQLVPGVLSLRIKRLAPEADHSHLSSAEVKNAWRYTVTHPCVIMACRVIKQRKKFTFCIFVISLSEHKLWSWWT